MKNTHFLQKIMASCKNQRDILYRIARNIEEKNNISKDLNHWEEVNILAENEKIFYKTWLWLNYLEYESQILKPIINEVKIIFTSFQYQDIFKMIENENYIENEMLEKFKIEGKAGKYLL